MADLNRRTACRNAIRDILAFTTGNDLAGSTIQRVDVQLQNLERNFNNFMEVQDRLIGANIPQAEFDVHEQLRATIQEEYNNAKVALEERADQLRQANAPVQQPVVAPQQQIVQIEGMNRLLAQKIENVWGEFDGTLWKWASFRDLYRAAVHDNEHMSNAQKFQQLRKSLKGEAREALGHWQVTDENYILAYQRLCELYDQPHRAATELLSRIFDLDELHGPSSKGLQHLSNVANDVKRQMTALNYDTEHWDVLFITILQRKLDNESKKEWEIKRNAENPTLEEMLQFIENRARALTNVKPEPSNHKEQKDNRKRFGDKFDYHNPPKKPFVANKSVQGTRTETSNPICAFCNGSHLTRLCNRYLAKERDGREKMVKEKRLCINCLKPGHMAKFCMSGKCTRCEQKHNSTLCPANPFLAKTNTITSKSIKKENKFSKKITS